MRAAPFYVLTVHSSILSLLPDSCPIGSADSGLVGLLTSLPRPRLSNISASFLLSSFCLLVSSSAPSELYPFVFFSLQNLSNKNGSLLNTSTIKLFDK